MADNIIRGSLAWVHSSPRLEFSFGVVVVMCIGMSLRYLGSHGGKAQLPRHLGEFAAISALGVAVWQFVESRQ